VSYDKVIAERKLDGSEMDIITLQEREQRHQIDTGYHVMPGHEYVELRDAYIKIIENIKKKSRRGIKEKCLFCGQEIKED
jgi:hypothetical protein